MFEPKLQSSLGIVANNSTKKDRSWNNGYLMFGEILNIHHKRNTADVRLLGSSNVITSDSAHEGIHSCRIGVNSAGVDKQFGKPYGEVIPLQKGMIVLVAFIRNIKEKPVIIKVFHDNSEEVGHPNYNNILTSVYPVESEVEMYRYLNVSRIQDFLTIDGVGNVELSSHTKSFFVATNKEIDEETFDYEDLSIKDKETNKTIGVPENHSFPFKFLVTFRDHFSDSKTNWLKMFIDAAKTSFKLVKAQRMDKKLTMLEIDQNGAFNVRRQMDSDSWKGGNKYSEVTIKESGEIEVTYNNSLITKITVDDSGISVSTESDITISSDNSIQFNANKIELNGKLLVNGESTIQNN